MQITNCGRGVHKREKKGVERLKALPNAWHAFTNLDLATGIGRSREIDMIIIADDRIFLIDLKDWNGTVESDGGRWKQNGIDRGESPVGKIHTNAKDVAYLLSDNLKRHAKGQHLTCPRVVGLVVMTGKADLSLVAGTEIGSVLSADNFIKAASTAQARVATFGPVARTFVSNPLTETDWKDRLSKFFNARVGPLKPGRRRYNSYLATSDHPSFEHATKIYAEYDAEDENTSHALGTLRVWDFAKADERFQTEEGRSEIAGRERSVGEFLRDRGEACENAILRVTDQDPERGVGFWEVYDRRRRLKRLSDFAQSERPGMPRDAVYELARQVISKVAAIHAADAAHLDLGGHSIWLQAPSTAKLSHLMAARYPEVASLGENRYRFLSSVETPEDILVKDASDPKRKDVFLLGVVIHQLVFGLRPHTEGDGLPPEWSADVDPQGEHEELHGWFEKTLALSPVDRFADAAAALQGFNAASANRPSPREIIERLEEFRGSVKSQKGLFAAYPETASIRESDRLDIWTSGDGATASFVKVWKRAAWGDQVREGPRILDFLQRAEDFRLSPPLGCARIRAVFWLGDAIALTQELVAGKNLAEALRAPNDTWGSADVALTFLGQLADTVVTLHERDIAHGDLKPQNIIVAGDGEPHPVLVDLVDFSPSVDGEIATPAYSPARGGRMERDRYAVTRIVEEVLGAFELREKTAVDLAEAIGTCRNTIPENGTLLPLVDALDRALKPAVDNRRLSMSIDVKDASAGNLLPDEGHFYVRKAPNGWSFFLRGAAEEIEVYVDNTGKPYRARRYDVDQKRIQRLSRFEFTSIEAEVNVVRTDVTDLSGLTPLLEDQGFQTGWNGASTPAEPEIASDEEDTQAGAFQDVAEDVLADTIADEPSEAMPVDVALLWRRLIDAESELTTEGVALGASFYSRDLKRHVVPFELSRGTFDYNRSDTVAVERLDRKGRWRRVGELDIGRSKPDRILIDPTEFSAGHQSGLVEEGQSLRFLSHFEPLRVSWRLLILRDWSHDEPHTPIFPRGPRACGPDGAGAPGRA